MPIGALSVLIQVSVLLIGGLISAGIGLLIGLACVRLKAWYLAMVTFGFSVIADTLSSQFDSFTNGINGFRTCNICARRVPILHFSDIFRGSFHFGYVSDYEVANGAWLSELYMATKLRQE